MGELLAAAFLLGLLGLLLVILANRGRWKRGLGKGETIALDNLTLHSEGLGLVGRPDRIVREGGFLIPEEWKSSRRVHQGHRLQLATYFLLIEDNFGVRPPHGFVVLGDGSRVQVENSERLRSEVLAVADEIRESRIRIEVEIPVNQPSWKCQTCGQRRNCRRNTS